MANSIGLKGKELALTEIRSDIAKLRLNTATTVVDTINISTPLSDFDIDVSSIVELVNTTQLDFTVGTESLNKSASYVEFLDSNDDVLIAKTLTGGFVLLSTEGIVSFEVGNLKVEI